VHVRAFDEVADVIQAGLLELGHPCERSVGRLLDLKSCPCRYALSPSLEK
jgi:hypothetical protein